MKCWVCNAEEGFKLCSTTLSDNRTAYRHYCPTCGNLIGAHVKKDFALACGYELTEQDGDTREYEYHRFMDDIYDWQSTLPKDFSDWHLVSANSCFYFYVGKHRFNHIIPLWIADSWEHCSYEDEDQFKDSGFYDLLSKVVDWDTFHSSINKQFQIPKLCHKIPSILYKDYEDYINSQKWQRQRANRMAIDNNECKLCFSRTNLHVHHITYENFGNEPMNELITVCKSCHEKIHGHEIN